MRSYARSGKYFRASKRTAYIEMRYVWEMMVSILDVTCRTPSMFPLDEQRRYPHGSLSFTVIGDFTVFARFPFDRFLM